MGSLHAAIKLHQKGRVSEAEEAYQRIIASEPNNWEALHLLGVVRHQQAKHAEALELIGRAIQIGPGNAAIHNNYGAVLLSLRQYSEADASFRRALAIRPDYADALANLGMAQAALGDEAGAEKSYRLALQFQAWHRDALTRLASLLERQRRVEEAVGLLKSALGAAPCSQFHLALGNLLRIASKYIEAAEHYRFAMLTSVAPRFQDGSGTPDLLRYDGSHVGQVGNLAESPKSPFPTESIAVPVPAERHGVRSLQGWGPGFAEGNQIEPRGRIAFMSPHCVLDFSNGAATATRDGLKLLASRGFQCLAFCGSQLDSGEKVPVEVVLGQHGEPFDVRAAQIGPFQGRMIFSGIASADGHLPVTIVDTMPTRDGWLNREEIAAFLTGCEMFLDATRPDLVWTYGGDPVSLVVQQMAKKRGIRVVFSLYNFSYFDRMPFEAVDCVFVPCEFSRRYCGESLGLECRVLPVIVNWEAAEVRERNPHYLTFINPHADKGVYIFARIALELARRRPDISILVTQGRSRHDALRNPALGLTPHLLGQFPVAPTCDGRNITTMPFTPDPRSFYPAVYSKTKLLLMPSLWLESFGLVAAEAMLNGIPVLASNRGALPDTIGDAGFLFDIPAKYTPKTRDVPAAEEVEPWVETIIHLWDDAAEYDRWSQRAHGHAEQWRPERLAPIYQDFFGNLCHRSRSERRHL
jgi:Tfp pilus assembly protein PilF/glycosyltransferase involved in cell wall biosynthesis